MAFNNRLKADNCCENYIFKKKQVKQVLELNSYNITTKLGMMYNYINKYSNLLLSSKRDRLLITNPTRNSRIMVEQTFAYEIVFNNFAYLT